MLRVLIALAIVAGALAEDPVVRVTGRLLDMDGQREVPVGLFGVHAAELTPAQYAEWGIESVRVIHAAPDGRPLMPGRDTPPGVGHLVECFYDRYRPALVLSEPDTWRQTLRELGTRYGKASAGDGVAHTIEFWNEPYLNWNVKPGVNYDPRFYEIAEAAEGAPVRIKGQLEPCEFLVWTKGRWFVSADGRSDPTTTAVAVGNSWQRAGLGDAAPGHLWEHNGRRYAVIETWLPSDRSLAERPEGQRWYSGRQNAVFYEQMFAEFGTALKAANPDVALVAGWGFHLHQGGWVPWESLFKPLIDRHIALIDGIDEHHYGGDTRVVAADYETCAAYVQATHGKRLRFYNTEAGAGFDAQRADAQRDPLGRWFAERYPDPGLQLAMAAYRYLVRDVVHLLAVCPDKAAARAAHQPHANGGDELAFRQLKDLRGQLLEVSGAGGAIWAVASRPTAERLTLVVFNDGPEMSTVPVAVTAPGDAELVSASVRQVAVTADRAHLVDEALALTADGTALVTVPARQAVAITGVLRPRAGRSRILTVRQFPGDCILQAVAPGGPITVTVAVPADLLARASGARLKLVASDTRDGLATWSLGKSTEPLVAGQWTLRQELPLGQLTASNAFTFATTGAGFGLWMVSLEILGDE